MPIEIKELQIKAVVSHTETRQTVPQADLKKEQERLKRAVIKECVEEVLQLLEDKKER